jgi:hypothetical protein
MLLLPLLPKIWTEDGDDDLMKTYSSGYLFGEDDKEFGGFSR